MNDATKLAIFSRLGAISAQVAKLNEDLGTGSPDTTVLDAASHLHDLSAELYDLMIVVAKPPGAYAMRSGDLVVIEEIAPGSERDRENQRLSEGFVELQRRAG